MGEMFAIQPAKFYADYIDLVCNLILLGFALCAFDVRRTKPLIFWIPVELASPLILRCDLFNNFFRRTSAFFFFVVS